MSESSLSTTGGRRLRATVDWMAGAVAWPSGEVVHRRELYTTVIIIAMAVQSKASWSRRHDAA